MIKGVRPDRFRLKQITVDIDFFQKEVVGVSVPTLPGIDGESQLDKPNVVFRPFHVLTRPLGGPQVEIFPGKRIVFTPIPVDANGRIPFSINENGIDNFPQLEMIKFNGRVDLACIINRTEASFSSASNASRPDQVNGPRT